MKTLYSVLLMLTLFSSLVSAYSGSFAVTPAIPGGPNHPETERFRINAEANTPFEIDADMDFVEKVTLEMDTDISGHLIIQERPTGSDPAFSFSVPQPIQNALVEAKIYIWAPDQPPLQIWHEHAGEDPVLLTASKIIPIQEDDDRILWMFTTSSFSDFYVDPEDMSPNKNIPIVAIIILALASLSSCILLRKQ